MTLWTAVYQTEGGGGHSWSDGGGSDVQTVAIVGPVSGQLGRQFEQATRAGRQLQNVAWITLGSRRKQVTHLV